jgi:hypothetical protein
VAEVESGIAGELGGHGARGRADRHRHDLRVEVGPVLALRILSPEVTYQSLVTASGRCDASVAICR